MRVNNLFLLTLLVMVLPQMICADIKPTIAIQSFGKFSTEFIEMIYAGIDSVYNVEVIVLQGIEIPQSAYYEPRNRYRAEKLLDYLEENTGDEFTKVLGLTRYDISTTKGEHKDWGIFGLGTLGGRTCVVSTFRLGENKVVQKLFIERLIKVVNHELGHTFGLNHCLHERCLMEDAKGKIKTVDNETGALCSECRELLKELVKK